MVLSLINDFKNILLSQTFLQNSYYVSACILLHRSYYNFVTIGRHHNIVIKTNKNHIIKILKNNAVPDHK